MTPEAAQAPTSKEVFKMSKKKSYLILNHNLDKTSRRGREGGKLEEGYSATFQSRPLQDFKPGGGRGTIEESKSSIPNPLP